MSVRIAAALVENLQKFSKGPPPEDEQLRKLYDGVVAAKERYIIAIATVAMMYAPDPESLRALQRKMNEYK